MNQAIVHTVIIYTLAHCPYCIKAKKLLAEKNIIYQEIAVEKYTEAQRIDLKNRSNGKSTVPQIFINGKNIGGCDDLYKLNSEGKLDELLNDSR